MGGPYPQHKGPWGYHALGMGTDLSHKTSLAATQRALCVSSVRHGERAPPQTIPIPHSKGLGGIRRYEWGESSPKGHPCPTLRGSRVYPALGMGKELALGNPYPPPGGTLEYLALGKGRELRHGLSLSPNRRHSGVCNDRYDQRPPPRVIPIPHLERPRGIPHQAWGESSAIGLPYPHLTGT